MERRSTINLEIADNGIIKNIQDSDVNGTGTDYESSTLYELDLDKELAKLKTIQFLNDLIDDLNLEVGSTSDKDVVTISLRKGEDYLYSTQELEEQIEKTEIHLENLKELRYSE